MPTHNCARFLSEAIESILGQSFRDLELVIVDDGSTDGSTELLGRYRAEDDRTRVLRNDRNRGIVYSLNRGLSECRGEYIARMDADDIAVPTRLALQVARLDEETDIAALGGALSYIDVTGRPVGRERRCAIGRSLLAGTPLLHPTVVLRRDVLVEHGLSYRDEYLWAEDYYLWLEISRVGRLSALDDVLLKYRLRDSAVRFKRVRGMLKATLRVKRDAVRRLGLRPTVSDVARFLAECAMVCLPAAVVRAVYLRTVLRSNPSMA